VTILKSNNKGQRNQIAGKMRRVTQ